MVLFCLFRWVWSHFTILRFLLSTVHTLFLTCFKRDLSSGFLRLSDQLYIPSLKFVNNNIYRGNWIIPSLQSDCDTLRYQQELLSGQTRIYSILQLVDVQKCSIQHGIYARKADIKKKIIRMNPNPKSWCLGDRHRPRGYQPATQRRRHGTHPHTIQQTY